MGRLSGWRSIRMRGDPHIVWTNPTCTGPKTPAMAASVSVVRSPSTRGDGSPIPGGDAPRSSSAGSECAPRATVVQSRSGDTPGTRLTPGSTLGRTSTKAMAWTRRPGWGSFSGSPASSPARTTRTPSSPQRFPCCWPSTTWLRPWSSARRAEGPSVATRSSGRTWPDRSRRTGRAGRTRSFGGLPGARRLGGAGHEPGDVPPPRRPRGRARPGPGWTPRPRTDDADALELALATLDTGLARACSRRQTSPTSPHG